MPTKANPRPSLSLLAAWTVAAALWFVSPWFPMELLESWQHRTGGWLSVTLVASLAIGLVQLAILFGPARRRPADIGWRTDGLLPALLAMLALWMLMQLGTLVAASVASTPAVAAEVWQRGWGLALGPLLAQLLGTALMEETVFRGYLWPELTRRFGGGRRAAWLAALASQAMFALLHLPMLVYRGASGAESGGMLVVLFLTGLVFVLIYAASGNLWLAVAVHALGNAPTLLFQPQGLAPTLLLLAGALALAFVMGLQRRPRNEKARRRAGLFWQQARGDSGEP